VVVRTVADDGVAPLFATLNNEWALRTWYPQPTAGTQQKASYLQLLEALLKAGADPNARTLTHIWYASYNTGRMGVDFAGATPSLRRLSVSDGGGAPEVSDAEILPGVEDMQVQLGLDTGGDLSIAARTATDWLRPLLTN